MLPDGRCRTKWKNLYLVRHGESTCNEVNRFAGAVDAPLTPLGEAQARKAAKQWRGTPPDIIFTSPLVRARNTAEIIFPDNHHSNPYTYHIDARISERHFGDFTLQNKAILQRKIGLRHYEDALYSDSPAMEDGESYEAFYERIRSFFVEKLEPYLLTGKKVLVVAHKYVIELLSRMILGLAIDDGYDLRLPNAKIIAGNKLAGYISKESRTFNLIQDWIVLHYSFVLVFATVIGILFCHFKVLSNLPSWLPLLTLSLATGVSLARVDLSSLKKFVFSKTPLRPLLNRYLCLPIVICCFATVVQDKHLFFFLALLMAAPSAITGITVTRSMGGLVTPAVRTILLSTIISIISTLPLLAARGVSGLLEPALWLLFISIAGLAIPMLFVGYLRHHHPIETANFAERNGATSILLLSLFIIFSFANIDLKSAWPGLPIVFSFAFLIRIVSLAMTNLKSLYALDDYISMSYPNIFFVVLLTSLLGLHDLAGLATWYLVPMFALAPFDEWICKKNLHSMQNKRLLHFLRIENHPLVNASPEKITPIPAFLTEAANGGYFATKMASIPLSSAKPAYRLRTSLGKLSFHSFWMKF